MTRYSRIARAVFGVPWAVMPTTMDAIVEVIERRIEGNRITEDEIAERLASSREAAAGRETAGQPGNIAVIRMYGVLSQRMNMMTEMSGGTSVQQLTQAFRLSIAEPSVTGIVFDIDSPGGSIAGIPELAAEIRNARGTKPIVAVANTLCASAAYWLAAQCDEIVVTPSSLIGSVGVVMVHEDLSAANEQAGVKVTYIYAGEYKVEGNPDEPLADEGKAYVQSLVDDAYALFVGDVAKGRGASAKDIRETYGQGRVLTPANSVKAGMADRIDTLDGALVRVAKGRVAAGRRSEHISYMMDGATVLWNSRDGDVTVHEGVGVSGAESLPAEPDATEQPSDPRPPDHSHVIALAKARARRRRAIPA